MTEKITGKKYAAKKKRKSYNTPLRIRHPPDKLAEARRLYEETRTPVTDIMAMLGLEAVAFYRRVARFGWVKRRKNPALLPPLSKTRSWPPDAQTGSACMLPQSGHGEPASGYICTGLSACIARHELLIRLIACAQRQEKMVEAVHQRFLALGGPPHQRQAEGHAWLMRELSSAQDTLRALEFLTAGVR